MPGFALPVSAPFGLCGRPLSLAAILPAQSPHPKIPFLTDKAHRLTSDFRRMGARPLPRQGVTAFGIQIRRQGNDLLLKAEAKPPMCTPMRKLMRRSGAALEFASAKAV